MLQWMRKLAPEDFFRWETGSFLSCSTLTSCLLLGFNSWAESRRSNWVIPESLRKGPVLCYEDPSLQRRGLSRESVEDLGGKLRGVQGACMGEDCRWLAWERRKCCSVREKKVGKGCRCTKRERLQWREEREEMM